MYSKKVKDGTKGLREFSKERVFNRIGKIFSLAVSPTGMKRKI